MPIRSRLDTDPTLAQRIVEEYVAGQSIDGLAFRYRVSSRGVRKTLIAHDVKIRSRRPEGRTPATGPLSEAEVERLRSVVGYQESWRTASLED